MPARKCGHFFEGNMSKRRTLTATAVIALLALTTCLCACSAFQLPDWAFDSLYAADALEYAIVTEPFFRYGEELAMTDHYPIFCDFAI